MIGRCPVILLLMLSVSAPKMSGGAMAAVAAAAATASSSRLAFQTFQTFSSFTRPSSFSLRRQASNVGWGSSRQPRERRMPFAATSTMDRRRSILLSKTSSLQSSTLGQDTASSTAATTTKRSFYGPTFEQPTATTRIGGDYCGLMATFDGKTGRLIPIPDYLIPKSLLEWGYPPSALELLVSEEYNPIPLMVRLFDDPSTMTSLPVWKRHIRTIYPATGCGVDNLETAATSEEHVGVSPSFTIWTGQTVEMNGSDKVPNHHAHNDWFAIHSYENNPHTSKSKNVQTLRVETGFGWVPHANDKDDTSIEKHDDVTRPLLHRSRIQVDINIYKNDGDDESRRDDKKASNDVKKWTVQIQSPIRVFLERQVQSAADVASTANTSTTTDESSVAAGMGIVHCFKNGGLDGRTVSQWLGPVLSKKEWQTFAERDMSGMQWNDGKYHVLPKNVSQVCDIVLPGNVTVQIWLSNSSLTMQVGQVYPPLQLRHVVNHSIPLPLSQCSENGSDNETELVAQTSRSATLHSWWERGTLEKA